MRLLLRWGVWMCYSEWRPDQPHEDWSGELSVEGGTIRNPNLVMYHGCWGAQRRTFVSLHEPRWQSPLINFDRPVFGYKGLEGLVVDVEGDQNTLFRFRSEMLSVEFRLGDIPEGEKLCWPAGAKYSCSQLVVCRLEDEGVYWNDQRSSAEQHLTGRRRIELGIERFRGDFVPRDMHHRFAAWIPPQGTVEVPFRWNTAGSAVATWRFTGAHWAHQLPTDLAGVFDGSNNVTVDIATCHGARDLSQGRYKAKSMRGASSALEHTDEIGQLSDDTEHVLSITNLSTNGAYLVLNSVTVQESPPDWAAAREYLPFRADWFDGLMPTGDMSADIPSGGKEILVGYDMNMMAAENGWIDATIRFLAATGAANYVLFRTESDSVSEADWRRWFTACRANGIHFAMNLQFLPVDTPIEKLLQLAAELGGPYFIGKKNHEMSLPVYAGWDETDSIPADKTLADAHHAYIVRLRDSYQISEQVPRILGEAALMHRYDYEAGVDLILSETMTGHTSLLLAEARGAARAYGRKLWGMHIACHVNCSPEDWRHERMFWLNLYMGYLSGASILEDEEGGLAKVHSFVSGPSDPLPAARQKTIAEFYRWALQHPRTEPLQVDIGFLYGRHEILTGGMSLNRKRPVRVWEGFGPALPQWEYGRPEYSWLLMDFFLPGVWLCPVLQDPVRLRRWFSGTPFGQIDIVPVEADAECLSSYKLLVLPGWHTMQSDDMDRLLQFVEQGGTLVLGIPQLQTSADRTAVLSSAEWDFVDADLVERLCGLQITGPGHACPGGRALGKEWTFEHAEDGELRLADISLCGGSADVEVDGRPMVVVNRLGKGRTFTFTAWDYFGHSGLLPFASAWLDNLSRELSFDVRLEGGDGEVAYFTYASGNGHRVVLLNTDWTAPGNTKHCTLRSNSGTSAEVAVREGEITEVVL